MSTFDVVFLVVVALSGLSAVVARNNLGLRRWTIRIYALTLVVLTFIFHMIAARLALRDIKDHGLTWTHDMAVGAKVMQKISMSLDWKLLALAVVLTILAARPPKQ